MSKKINIIAVIISVVIILTGLSMAIGVFKPLSGEKAEMVERISTVSSLLPYTFGADFYTEMYNSTYTIEKDVRNMSSTQRMGFDAILRSISNAQKTQSRNNEIYIGILISCIGLVSMFLFLNQLSHCEKRKMKEEIQYNDKQPDAEESELEPKEEQYSIEEKYEEQNNADRNQENHDTEGIEENFNAEINEEDNDYVEEKEVEGSIL